MSELICDAVAFVCDFVCETVSVFAIWHHHGEGAKGKAPWPNDNVMNSHTRGRNMSRLDCAALTAGESFVLPGRVGDPLCRITVRWALSGSRMDARRCRVPDLFQNMVAIAIGCLHCIYSTSKYAICRCFCAGQVWRVFGATVACRAGWSALPRVEKVYF